MRFCDFLITIGEYCIAFIALLTTRILRNVAVLYCYIENV